MYSPRRIFQFRLPHLGLFWILVLVFAVAGSLKAQTLVSNDVSLYGWLDQHSLDTSNNFTGNEACGPTSLVNCLTYLQNLNPTLFSTNLTGGTNISSTQGSPNSYNNWITTDQTLIGLMGTQPNSGSSPGTSVTDLLAGGKVYLLRVGYYSDITIQNSNATIAGLINNLNNNDAVEALIRYTNDSGGHFLMLNGLDWNSVSNVGTLYFVDPLNPSQNYSNSSVLGPVLQTSGSLTETSANYLLQYEQLRGNNLTNPYPNPATNTNSTSAYLTNLTILSVTPSSNTNSAWGNLVIGSNSISTNYTISTGTNIYSNTIIGMATNSSNNQLIANTNTLLSNSVNLYVGNYGASNSMIITNGGVVAGEYGIIGNYSTSSNNSVLVTGAGSIWTNAGDIAVGFDGSGNSLVISNGGAVLGGKDGVGGIIGADIPSSNNSVLVTGSSSSWSNSLDLYVGFAGNNNSLTISNSAVVHDANGFIGNYYLSSNNVVQVTGTNSLWSNVGNLYVGNSGSSNSLVISNAGRVNDSNAYIGFDVTGNPSNNSVTVTGSNSTWSNSGNLYVGFEGSNNSMVISNGGKVADGNGYIGHTNTSSNNSVLVTGIGSLWSNRVTLTIAASNTLTVANGGAVVAVGGITNSGTLTGNGTIGGATTIASGGTLTPGSGGVGSMTFTNGLSLQTGATTTFQINTKADFTSINILGNSITYGGNLVFNILNYTPSAGDAFTLFNMTGGAIQSGDFNTVTAGSLSFLNNGGIWSANNGSYLYQFSDSTGQLTLQSAPEPSTYALFGIGAIGLLMVMRRKKTA